MTCQEALRLLYEVIDKEASDIDIEEVKKHLAHCSDCMSRYEFEKMFKAFVTEKSTSSVKSAQLKAKILSRIEDAQTETSYRQPSPLRKRLLYLASAAALILFVTAALAVAQFYRHQKFVYPFEKNHMTADNTAGGQIISAAALDGVKDYLAGSMHLAINSDPQGFSLAHAGFDDIRGQHFVHLRYDNGESQVSLFVGNAADMEMPGFAREISEGTEYFKLICLQCQVVYWTRGNTIFIAVSENKKIDLPVLISAIVPL
ncbi:hypothetical protein TRIP_C20287 [Candidatus Zixiibacteriota bacterium]|nr:hypothetical protein TRIP_C20287 [candidate division Zixibacteria bacterium]